jgi:pyruvate dehydrogenase E1 component alpha subunit
MDPVAMVEGSRFALEWCRSGKGPIIMEACSYRYSGHSMSDPGTSYRTRDEVQEVRKSRDPIGTFKEKIIKANLVTDDELKASFSPWQFQSIFYTVKISLIFVSGN